MQCSAPGAPEVPSAPPPPPSVAAAASTGGISMSIASPCSHGGSYSESIQRLKRTAHNPLIGTNRNLSLENQFFTSIYSKMSTDLRTDHCIPRFCLLPLQISPYYSPKIAFYRTGRDFTTVKPSVVHLSTMVWSCCSSLRKPRMTSLDQLCMGFQMRYIRTRCSVLLCYFYSHLCK